MHVKCREHDVSAGAGRLDRAAWLNFVTNRKSASEVLSALDTVLKVNMQNKNFVDNSRKYFLISALANLLGRPQYRSAFTCDIARHACSFFWTIATRVTYLA